MFIGRKDILADLETLWRKRTSIRPGMTVRPVLVYAGELAKSVEADGYFDALIPAAKLLGR